jgi:GNAT superfamily N-acetyltransferase
MRIRPALPADAPVLLELIRGLAEYEKLSHAVTADVGMLEENLFVRRHAEALLVEDGGAAIAFALYFHNFSTFLARPGLYLEDLFVRPAHRGKGAGKALMVALARIAVERGCGRFEWSVLDWNKPSIDFYRSLGAVGMDEWTVQRVTGAALASLASRPLEAEFVQAQ